MNTNAMLFTDEEVEEMISDADTASTNMNTLARAALEHRTDINNQKVSSAAYVCAMMVRPLINALGQYQAENRILRQRLVDKENK